MLRWEWNSFINTVTLLVCWGRGHQECICCICQQMSWKRLLFKYSIYFSMMYWAKFGWFANWFWRSQKYKIFMDGQTLAKDDQKTQLSFQLKLAKTYLPCMFVHQSVYPCLYIESFKFVCLYFHNFFYRCML